MIHESIEHLLLYQDDELMIDASRCATVREENTLMHALMLLSTVGYAEIPVLDQDQRLKGVISMPLILAGIKDSLEYNWSLLAEKKVSEVMSKDIGVIYMPYELEDVLHELVNHNFACVVDSHRRFTGIITRKEILTRVNFMAHQMDRFYDLGPKEQIMSLIS